MYRDYGERWILERDWAQRGEVEHERPHSTLRGAAYTGPMEPCERCGSRNPEGFRFCGACGAPLATTLRGHHDVRKTVTILFVDVVGSTALGEGSDPEATRALLERYFRAMRSAIERHGGTVEKFIGDAVMAVFGLPVAHEDDALRAVRAAHDMVAALADLNAVIGAGVRIRTGINTGEIVAGMGPGETLVTGDPVNVAARLEQVAAPGDILLGGATYRLVRGRVEAGPPTSVHVRGRSAPVTAYRFMRLQPERDSEPGRSDSPMVGRGSELAALRGALEQVGSTGRPMLAVVVGSAGVGKSRLVREFLLDARQVGGVVRGRCLPYGQGITFWPIGEIVRQAMGIEESDTADAARARLRSRLAGMPDERHIAVALERLLGLGSGGSPVEELAWATRRLLERLAGSRPLVVVIEDVHWAEPALLDLIEHVVTEGQGPLLLVTPTRPEINESRPAMLVGPQTLHLALEPLGDEPSSELIDRLLPGTGGVEALRSRIAETAAGNPLYVEELVGMLVDDGSVRRAGGGSWIVERPIDRIAMPPTIGALLTARLDQMGPERIVAERGAVVGRVFEHAAVAHLSPDLAEDALALHVATLVDRDLVRPESTSVAEELAYRFRHILIRDAAYESLPKAERARLHESLADWLEAVAGDRLAEVEEIVGYHQERAVLHRRDLGSTDELASLGRRAADHLAAAAVRAADRGDTHAATNLFERAAAMTPPGDRGRDRLLVELSIALTRSNALDRASEIAADVVERATAIGDEVTRYHAVVQHWQIGELASEDQGGIRSDARDAIRVFEAARDDLGLARAWRLVESAHWYAGEGASAEAAVLRALEHARRAGRRSEIGLCYEDLTSALNTGPTRVEVGIERCKAVLATEGDDRIIGAWMGHALAHLEAKRGAFDEARAHAATIRRVLKENGQTLEHALIAEAAADVEYLAGNAPAAVRILSEGLDTTHRLGQRSAILAAHLGHVAWHAGELDIAEGTADEGMSTGGWTRALTLGTLGRVRAGQGRHAQAEALVREALAYWKTTDYLTYHGWTLEALGDVLAMEGRVLEAIAALEEAADLHHRKGSRVGVATVRDRLAALHSGAKS